MRTHHDQKHFAYTTRQLFDLVSNVGAYPDFIPWVQAARISERTDTSFIAELIVRFKGITERYTSHVELMPPNDAGIATIDVMLVKGPFNHLENHWVFTPSDDGECDVEFQVAFEFKNKMLDMMIGGLFARATEKMIDAFSERAKDLYGA